MHSSSARMVVAAALAAWLCASIGAASDSKSKPKNVEIKHPNENDALRARSPFQIEGKIKEAKDGKAPEVVLVRILREGNEKVQVGSWGIRLGEDAPESSFQRDDRDYVFKLKVNALKRAGKYSITATSITPDKDGDGKTKLAEETSDPVEIEVKD